MVSRAGWTVLSVATPLTFALGAAVMTQNADIMLSLLVVPMAWAGLFLPTPLVVVSMLAGSGAALSQIALGHVSDRSLAFAGARLFTILVTAIVTHGLARELRASRHAATHIAEAVDEHLYTARCRAGGRGELVLLGGADRIARLLGARPPAGVSLDDAWARAVHRDDRAAYDAAVLRMAREPVELEYRLVGLDGVVRTVWDRARPRKEADGGCFVDGIVSDVTEQRRVDDELAEARANIDRIVATIDESLYTIERVEGSSFRCLYAAPGFEAILGSQRLDEEELYAAWRAAVHPDDRAAFVEGEAALAEGTAVEQEYRLRGADGVDRWVLDRGKPRFAGGRLLVDGILIDVTARRQGEEKLERALAESESLAAELAHANEVDPLTGAMSRRRFQQALDERIEQARAEGGSLAVLLLDVDNFKRINDSFGHGVGDEVLVAVARRLRQAARDDDLVARYGGEEFVVLLSDVEDDATLREVGERVRRGVGASAVFTHAGALAVTASVGAARQLAALGSASLLAEADLAMYSAKRRGRNQTRLHVDLTAEDRVAEEPEAIRIAQALAWTASAHEGPVDDHSGQVADLAAAVAEHLRLPAALVLRARLGGWLHDVGNVAVPDEILRKTAPLDPAERHALRQHVIVGEQIVQRIDRLSDAAPAVRHHHERVDGDGYPDGLRGESIPIEARIVAAVDAYCAMTRERPYGVASTHEEAVAELEQIAGAHLDERVVHALLEVLADGPAVVAAPRREHDRRKPGEPGADAKVA
jgi:diguanylate cyclase (GGDEF)-like protein/PAS domain S-box-containing protein